MSRDTADGRTEAERSLIRHAVFDRDGGRCLLRPAGTGADLFGRRLPCIGHLTPHHLRKSGQGGSYTMSNLLSLCAGHNDMVEVLPRADMVAAGLVVPRGTDIGTAWALLQLAGIVEWWWDGSPGTRTRPDAIADTWRQP